MINLKKVLIGGYDKKDVQLKFDVFYEMVERYLDEQKKEQATTSRFQYIPDGLLERYHTRIVPMLKDTMWIVPSELVWLNARIDGKSRQDFIYYSNESEQQFHLLDTPFWINSGLTNGETKANKEK